MRIVLLNQYYAPDEASTAQLLSDVGAGLVAAGHEVAAVCCNRSYTDPSRRYPARETIDGVEVTRASATGFGRGSTLGRVTDYASFLAGAAARLVLRRRPDVVISLSTPPMVALLGWLAARLRRARTIYWVMDVYPDLAYELGVIERGALAGRLLDRISRFQLGHSDRVVVLGELMAERLPAVGERPPLVVHNWADGDTIRPRPLAGNELRREWGWDGSFVVLYSGNMGLAHEFDTVLDAAGLLADEPDVRFAFVGGGPRRGAVEQEVRRSGLSNVEFRPYVARERLGESLTAGDLHLVTLRPAAVGLLVPSKIYGILAAGRPTLYVGPPVGEVAEIVRGGQCGVCVDVGDARRLAAAVRAYRDDPGRARHEGGRARRLFEERFTRGRGVGHFVDLVREVTL